MAQHNETGKLGEQLSVSFLKKAGFEIIAVNWKAMKYEIDIIVKKNNIIIFVEVKTRTPNNVSSPEKSITKFKQKHLIEAVNIYINENNITCEARIDFIFIYIKNKKYWIKHIENAIIPKW